MSVTAAQYSTAGDLRYQDGWQVLRGLLSPDGTVNKGDARLVTVREAWEEAAGRFQQAGGLLAGAGRAQEYVRAALAYLSLAWLDRLLGEAKASASASVEMLDLARGADRTVADKIGADWIWARAQTILSRPGLDGDLAPQWGAKFLDPPSGGIGWLALLLAAGIAIAKSRAV